MNTKLYFTILLILLIISPTTSSTTGQATRHIFSTTGNCGFKDFYDITNHVAAISSDKYESSLSCGGCALLTGPKGKSARVRVIDKCLDCAENSFDVSYDVFEIIKGDNDGVANINWEWVPCYNEGNFKYYIDNGANEYYISFQIRNASMRVKNVYIYSNISGQWNLMSRRDDFYFYFNTGSVLQKPLMIKVESISGEIVSDNINGYKAGATIQGNVRFKENGEKNFGGWLKNGWLGYLLVIMGILM